MLRRLFRRLFLQGLQQAYLTGQLQFHGQLTYLAQPLAFARLLRGCAPAVVALCQTALCWTAANARLSRPLHSSRRYFQSAAALLPEWLRYLYLERLCARQLLSLMTLSTDEFMRRFLLHVLPRGFQRLRQFGLLANRHRRLKLQTCRTLLGVAHTPVIDALPADDQTLYQTLTGNSLRHCPA